MKKNYIAAMGKNEASASLLTLHRTVKWCASLANVRKIPKKKLNTVKKKLQTVLVFTDKN